ncbi:hypothetical protein [Streptomyces sp. NBC_01092]|uniref:hypothetical protein n=1 Tax=Streptomyces sp. NBC_01092 TaxID=2903748 RepID=UPI003866FAAB|nr:hypothetical protein OG254_00240 [Streptomyces sp. NBC_01092]WSU55731.1 hypothetical protein OG254_49185 [Streptomyces sp. NBC_01092]
MSDKQGTAGPDPSGPTAGGRPAQPRQVAEDKASKRTDFAKKAGLAAIGGAFSGTFRVVASSIRDAFLGSSTTD